MSETDTVTSTAGASTGSLHHRVGAGAPSRAAARERSVDPDVEEDEVALAARLLDGSRRLRLELVQPFPRPLRTGPVAPAFQFGRQLFQLLARLGPARRHAEQFREHDPDLLAARELVGELHHVAERGVPHVVAVHPIEILDQVLLGLAGHVLPGVQPGELDVGAGAVGVVAKDLAADGDRVV